MASLPLGKGESPNSPRLLLTPLQLVGQGCLITAGWGWKWLLLMSQVGLRRASSPPDESLGFLHGLL